jgi:flagellar export protein FliJ
MKRFAFRLQTLLKARAAKRDECRQQLAKAYQADQILVDHREQLQGELNETKQTARHLVEPGDLRVEQLLNANRYELVLSAQIQQVEEQRKLVATEIERRRQSLIEADRQLRILVKLKERQWAEYLDHEEKTEIRNLDEIALRRVGSRASRAPQ